MSSYRVVKYVVGYDAQVPDGNQGTLIEFKGLQHFDDHAQADEFARACTVLNYVLYIREVYVLEHE